MSYTFLKFRNEYNHEKVSGIVEEEFSKDLISFVRFLSTKFEVCTIVNNIKYDSILINLDSDELIEFIKELIEIHRYDDFDEVPNVECLTRRQFKEVCESLETYFKTIWYMDFGVVCKFEMFFN